MSTTLCFMLLPPSWRALCYQAIRTSYRSLFGEAFVLISSKTSCCTAFSLQQLFTVYKRQATVWGHRYPQLKCLPLASTKAPNLTPQLSVVSLAFLLFLDHSWSTACRPRCGGAFSSSFVTRCGSKGFVFIDKFCWSWISSSMCELYFCSLPLVVVSEEKDLL